MRRIVNALVIALALGSLALPTNGQTLDGKIISDEPVSHADAESAAQFLAMSGYLIHQADNLATHVQQRYLDTARAMSGIKSQEIRSFTNMPHMRASHPIQDPELKGLKAGVAAQDNLKRTLPGRRLAKGDPNTLLDAMNQPQLRGLASGTKGNIARLRNQELTPHLKRAGYPGGPADFRRKTSLLSQGKYMQAGLTKANVRAYCDASASATDAGAQKEGALAKQNIARQRQNISALQRKAETAKTAAEKTFYQQQVRSKSKNLADGMERLRKTTVSNQNRLGKGPSYRPQATRTFKLGPQGTKVLNKLGGYVPPADAHTKLAAKTCGAIGAGFTVYKGYQAAVDPEKGSFFRFLRDELAEEAVNKAITVLGAAPGTLKMAQFSYVVGYQGGLILGELPYPGSGRTVNQKVEGEFGAVVDYLNGTKKKQLHNAIYGTDKEEKAYFKQLLAEEQKPLPDGMSENDLFRQAQWRRHQGKGTLTEEVKRQLSIGVLSRQLKAGMAAYRARNWRHAVKLLSAIRGNEGLIKRQRRSTYLLHLARAYFHVQEHRNASQVFRQVLPYFPDMPYLQYALGSTLALQKKCSDGREHLTRYIEVCGKVPPPPECNRPLSMAERKYNMYQAYFRRGNCRPKHDRWGRARDYQHALAFTREKQKPGLWFYLGLEMWGLRRWVAAGRWFARVVNARHRLAAQSQFWWGDAEFRRGRKYSACEHFKKSRAPRYLGGHTRMLRRYGCLRSTRVVTYSPRHYPPSGGGYRPRPTYGGGYRPRPTYGGGHRPRPTSSSPPPRRDRIEWRKEYCAGVASHVVHYEYLVVNGVPYRHRKRNRIDCNAIQREILRRRRRR
ncbi:MAG: hypothetical protein ABI333_13610 [bacterium]